MFYDKQSKKQKTDYKNMLSSIGAISKLFSDSDKPMLYYRAHENCFCKYFMVENLARHDCSADAKKDNIGIGLKTWVGSNIQKVAEFGKLKNELDGLNDDELVVRVAEFRNSRIKTTMNLYNLQKMIYHIIIRTNKQMNIEECSFDFINIKKIKRLPLKDNVNTRYFTDENHIYSYNIAKTTLYMLFDNLEHLDDFQVNILDDPFDYLNNVLPFTNPLFTEPKKSSYRRLALKLYKDTKNGPIVEEKSSLNLWNAKGRTRHHDEVYIPFNKIDREKAENHNFFPNPEIPFKLNLPNGKQIIARICQENGKAIMSNPNKDLGHWLLREILELPEGTLVTYPLLQEKGFDTVLFEKINDTEYTIYFTDSSIYEELYGK